METHSHQFPQSDWPFDEPVNMAVFTTSRVVEGAPVLLVTLELDGDWQILCGTTNDLQDVKVACFGCAYQQNPEIGELADLPLGWLAWRKDVGSPWIREVMEDEEEQS